MKIKFGKVLDYLLPIIGGFAVQLIQKRGEKRAEKKELDKPE